jgi:hypothetical protein
LFAPRVSPETNCFWRAKNTTRVGTATMSAAAEMRLLLMKN